MQRPEVMAELKVESIAVGFGLLITLITGAVSIELRYAKAEDVKQMVEAMYDKTLRLRVLELELKGNQLQPHERALLDHMKRELRE